MASEANALVNGRIALVRASISAEGQCAVQMLAFTNHMVMLEALESWPVEVLGSYQELSNAQCT